MSCNAVSRTLRYANAIARYFYDYLIFTRSRSQCMSDLESLYSEAALLYHGCLHIDSAQKLRTATIYFCVTQ